MTGPLLPGDPERLGSIRLLGRLGAGGMGTVYLGRTPGGRAVAVKTVHEHLAADPHFRERFRREAAAARAVTGAHTAAVLDADPESSRPWLATAYLPGVTLRHAVAATGPLAPSAVRSLGAALAEALEAVHRAGLVHRDLKPSNVLVTADGPRVIDFGIARAIGDHGLTGAGDVIGTPGFIAPEQITGAIVAGAAVARGAVTEAADVFALGAVLVFAATGGSPFGSATPAVLLYRAVHEDPDLSGVPDEVREVVTACLEKDPGLRPTVDQVLRATADPHPALWWRTEPLRSLVLGEAAEQRVEQAAEEPAATPGPQATPRTALAPGPPGTRRLSALPPPPVVRSRAARRGELARRGLLLAGGGGLASLVTYAFLRSGGAGEREERVEDPLRIRPGSARQGALRWTLSPAFESTSVDALRSAGSSLLVHGVAGPDVGRAGSSGGYVTARRAGDAGRRWLADAEENAPTQWGASGSVLVAADVGLNALDLATGEPRGEPAERPAPLWFTVAAGTLISGFGADGDAPTLTAVDLRTGARRWTGGMAEARPPAVLDRSVLLADEDGGNIRCVDAVSGELRWAYEEFEGPVVALAAVPGAGCFVLLGIGGALHFLRTRDGGRLATAALEGGPNSGSSALAAVGSTVLLTTGGRVHAYAPDTGRHLWSAGTVGLDTSWPAGTGGLRAPVTAGGSLLHWARAGVLQCLDLRSGEERWAAAFGGVGQVPPVVAGGTVYAATGELCRALDVNRGTVQRGWEVTDVRDLAADPSGWYARIGTKAIRAYHHTAAPVRGS
ncbi:PQQ-binding-like beta-propeller repeat protein [Streptomyces sp. DH18]|uniref:serine/threonine-protein kinase n=1 Tax=Streptomyces sp. DH18 TaxID=3040126 RepID=UPI0024423E4A|nr:serine/threonine-protein kinase [Streptomyces sp. DH18]MDG9688059.1 PQQ-binding-like beta-propeller repeat protein [Streptomyces sp. DH18]